MQTDSAIKTERYGLEVEQQVYLRCTVTELKDNCMVTVKPTEEGFDYMRLTIHRNSVVPVKELTQVVEPVVVEPVYTPRLALCAVFGLAWVGLLVDSVTRNLGGLLVDSVTRNLGGIGIITLTMLTCLFLMNTATAFKDMAVEKTGKE